MLTTLKTATLSAMIGLGAITALPAAANAQDVYLGFGDRHRDGISGGVHIGGDRADYRRHRDRDDDRWDRKDERRCTPQRALNKAERMGLRRTRIEDVDRRTIEISGRKFGDRVYLTFGRAPNCPILGW